MAMSVREGFHTLTPYMIFDDPGKAIDYYKQAFGATEIGRHVDGKGGIRHAEIIIGDSPMMLCGTTPDYPSMKAPSSYGGSPAQLFIYASDPDAMIQAAVDAGGRIVLEIADRPYGRGGGVEDPFGYTWWINSHKEM